MYTIEQLEYDVWVLQGHLQELRQNRNSMSQEEYTDRLNYLEFQLHHMQEEIQKMRGINVNLEKVVRNAVSPERYGGEILPLNPEYWNNLKPNNIPEVSLPPIKKQPRDLEKTFGTGIMGIIASILVFISIIIFGTLLIPYLSEEIMVLLMFLVSFILAGTGYFLLQKNATNKFNLSLCACGVTAIAVSLFVTRLYFGFIDNIIFLALMSVWMAMMAFLCKKYNYLFRIIGEIGILMTCILGLVEISFTAEWYSYVVLVIVFGVSSFVFQYVKPRESYEKNTFSHIIHTIAFIAFVMPIETLAIPFMGAKREILWIELFIMVISFILLVAIEMFIVWKEHINHGILFYILTAIQMLILSIAISLLNENLDSSPFMILSSLFMLFLFSKKQTKFNLVGDICVNFLYLCGAIYFAGESNFGAILCVLPLFLYGTYKHKKSFLYGGLIGTVSIFFIYEYTALGFFMGAFIPLLLFLVVSRKEQDGIFASIGYPWLLIIFGYGFSEALYPTEFLYSEINTMTFIIIALIHILVIKGNMLRLNSKIFEIVSSIVTAFLMLVSLPMMYNDSMTILVTLFTIALFVINSKKLLEKSEFWGYYIAFKYTVLMLVILDVSWDLAIVYSICMLLFSLASILLGFLYEHKSFRIYGLLLSMMSVFKLILFDVDGKSMTYNAFGFLICGLICFGISFIYNKIEQKINKK